MSFRFVDGKPDINMMSRKQIEKLEIRFDPEKLVLHRPAVYTIDDIKELLNDMHANEDLEKINRMPDDEIIDRLKDIQSMLEDRMNDAFHDTLREFFLDFASIERGTY